MILMINEALSFKLGQRSLTALEYFATQVQVVAGASLIPIGTKVTISLV